MISPGDLIMVSTMPGVRRVVNVADCGARFYISTRAIGDTHSAADIGYTLPVSWAKEPRGLLSYQGRTFRLIRFADR